MQDKDEDDDLFGEMNNVLARLRAQIKQSCDKMREDIKNNLNKERDKQIIDLMTTLKDDLEHQVSLLRSMKASNTSATDYSSLFSTAENLQKLCLNVFVALKEEKYSEMPIDGIEQSVMKCKEQITTTMNKKTDYHRNRYFSTTGKSLSILNELTNTVNRIQEHAADIRRLYIKEQSNTITNDTNPSNSI